MCEGSKDSCSQCNLRELCLPVGLGRAELDKFAAVIGGRHRIKRGCHLYSSGQAFNAIYAVKSGFFKTDMLTEDGRHQVTGFQMAGEILGMDGIGNEVHTCNAVALEDSDVCWFPFASFEGLGSKVDTLQHQFHKIMSREIVRDHRVMMLLGTRRAHESLATFLLNLSQRFMARGYSPTEFELRMTREEIGSHLGLKLETISRAFSQIHEAGIISVQWKHIHILDMPRLKALTLTAPTNSPCHDMETYPEVDVAIKYAKRYPIVHHSRPALVANRA